MSRSQVMSHPQAGMHGCSTPRHDGLRPGIRQFVDRGLGHALDGH
jgi:hypothetical protein